MTEFYVPIALTPGLKCLSLKSISGAEEIAIEDTSIRSALMLLDGLLSKNHFQAVSNNGVNVAKISTADRDRVLATAYVAIYGDKIESTVACRNCRNPFDIDFSLHDLLIHYPCKAVPPAEDGTFELEPSVRFRMPTGEDELLLTGMPPLAAEKKLWEKCILSSNPERVALMVQQRMAEMAPVLHLEIEVVCAECGFNQQFLFDMQSYLLTKLKQERPQLLREIHLIASHYHWSQQEILGVPRKTRKQLVALIEGENKSW